MSNRPPGWRYVWAPLQWLACIGLFKIVLPLLGLFVVALFAHKDCRKWPKWAIGWGELDGGNPPRWGENPRPEWAAKCEWCGRYVYCQFRNWGWNPPLKDADEYKTYGSWTDTAMEPKDLVAKGVRKAWRWRTAGPLDGLRVVNIDRVSAKGIEYKELWVGWKIASPVPGLGFSLQRRKGTQPLR